MPANTILSNAKYKVPAPIIQIRGPRTAAEAKRAPGAEDRRAHEHTG